MFYDLSILMSSSNSNAFIFISGTESLKRQLQEIAVKRNIQFIVYDHNTMTPKSCIDQVAVSINQKIEFKLCAK